jgi:hypothetical protein
MKLVADQKTKEAAEKQKMEKELAKVKLIKEDVDFIVRIFNIKWYQLEMKFKCAGLDTRDCPLARDNQICL